MSGKLPKNDLLKIQKIVIKDSDENISQVIRPHRLEIGLPDGDYPDFQKGFNAYGDSSVSGSLTLTGSGYVNFGDSSGEDSYGFRDNAGILQYRNKSTPGLNPTSWTTFGTAGNPAGSNTQVQFNDGGSAFGGDAKFVWDKTASVLTVGSTGLAGDYGVIRCFDTISGSIHHTAGGKSYIVAGTGVTVASSSDGSITISATGGGGGSLTVVSQSVSVGSVTTIAASDGFLVVDEGSGRAALSASIGDPEDGTYSDGLFTDFTPGTRLGVAIDRFNEVLKGLAPSAAPGLDNMDSNSYGPVAKLSFGSSQSVSGYTNVQPSTLSSPASALSDVNINGSYNTVIPTDSDIRAACFNGSSTIEGTLNEDVSADGVNYPEHAFGNGDQGSLNLFVNNNASAIHSVDLSSFGSGNSLNGNGSGFINLSAADPAHFADGSEFATFKHRSGSFRVTATDQRNGWNYARITHVVGSATSSCNYVEWVNDSDSNALAAAGSALDTLSMTGLNTLSGVRYNTGGTAQYRVRVTNAYKNIYSQNNITFAGTNCAVSAQAFPSINFGAGENENKVLHITGSATINADPILNAAISVGVNVPHPLKSNISNGGSQSISGILLYDLSNTSTVTSETFRAENYRKISGSYATQGDVTSNSTNWSSSVHMSASNAGHEDGLMFYNSRLRAPRQGANSGDFRNTADGGSIANGPAENVNYSGINSGKRTFYRYFQNNSGGAKTDFSLTINGSGTIVSQGTNLGTGNISVLVKLPNTSANQFTGWMDLALPFSTGQTSDGDGCLNGSLDSSLNATNNATFGTIFVDSNEYIMLKVEADASFTGNINTISLSWL